jgi:probable biosynthetic protein (TIGR04098 family)
MPLIRSLIDRAMVRIHGRNEYESLALRRYFKKHYDIEVGLHTIGPFDRWRVPPGSRIGRYCSIARTARLLDADHPVDALSTHPYFYLRGFGVVAEDMLHLQPPLVEDGVWIGHNAIITPGCHRIGRGAVVGAGAVVMQDVPAYAIVTGSPARLVRYRFDADTIAVIEATRWWELDRTALAAAVRSGPAFARHPARSTAEAFIQALPGIRLPPRTDASGQRDQHLAGLDAEAVRRLLTAEIPALADNGFDLPFTDLGIDSFGLISLRVAVEQLAGRQIPDRLWGALVSPADLLALAATAAHPADRIAAAPPTAAAPPARIARSAATASGAQTRRITINMPQMAMRGLSEAWLFKEMGDLHWQALCQGLKTPSAAIADSEGQRLYATFTRIRLDLDAPLTAFRENDELALDLAPSRLGAGMFFGALAIRSPTAGGKAELMTSFAKFGEAGANTSLMKGQPVIPEDCAIPALPAPPAFAMEYRALRAEPLPPALFETRYEIQPVHDINGVGLLYFAAYPMIADLCVARHAGAELLSGHSTTNREICYFANAMPDETLLFRLHSWDADAGAVRFRSSLSRASDGKMMALIDTRKARIAAAPVR